jgi:hypothetical protein
MSDETPHPFDTRKWKELRQEARKLLREISQLRSLHERDALFLKTLANEEKPDPIIMINAAASAVAMINNKPKEAS